jgi:hypothetical protein
VGVRTKKSIAGSATGERAGFLPKQMVRTRWVLATLVVAGSAVGVLLHLRGREARASGSASREVAAAPTSSNADELESLKSAIRALDRRSAALEIQLATERQVAAARVASSAEAAPAKVDDNRTAAEIKQDTLASLDAALTADRGDARDLSATARTLTRELTETAQGKAKIVGVQCASAFCKAVIEEDATSGQPLDMNAILALPALKAETMLDYRTEGGRKRVTVYAAREGLTLPLPRAPLPEHAEAETLSRVP